MRYFKHVAKSELYKVETEIHEGTAALICESRIIKDVLVCDLFTCI